MSSSARPRRSRLVLLAVVVAVAAGAAWLRFGDGIGTASSTVSAESDGGPAAVATDPPVASRTVDPVQPHPSSSGAVPSRIGATAAAPSSPAGGSASSALERVAVATTYTGYDDGSTAVLVDGFVRGVIESGGTCTVTLTLGGRSVPATAPAQPDASTTSCGEVSVPRSRLASGSWSGVLRYTSSRATGESQTFTVVVP